MLFEVALNSRFVSRRYVPTMLYTETEGKDNSILFSSGLF